MDFKRSIEHLNDDLRREKSYLTSAEHSLDYHMKEIVREQEKIEERKLEIQEISKEIYLLQRLQIKL